MIQFASILLSTWFYHLPEQSSHYFSLSRSVRLYVCVNYIKLQVGVQKCLVAEIERTLERMLCANTCQSNIC